MTTTNLSNFWRGSLARATENINTDHKMNTFKIYFDDGDSVVTGYNGTHEDAKRYYIGNLFERQDETTHRGIRVEVVEIVEPRTQVILEKLRACYRVAVRIDGATSRYEDGPEALPLIISGLRYATNGDKVNWAFVGMNEAALIEYLAAGYNVEQLVEADLMAEIDYQRRTDQATFDKEGKLSVGQRVFLNELQIVREERGKLCLLNAVRVRWLERHVSLV